MTVARSNQRSRLLSLIRQLWWVAFLGLALQAFWALRLEHPTYFDAYYYTLNARQLATGQGFWEEIIWHYLDDPQGIPTPSHTYWMPLASIIGAAGYWLSGTFRGAQLPFWLMAGLLPLLSYAISWQLQRRRFQAYAAAALTATGGYYAAYWVQPTTFVLFAWVGGSCLLFLALAQKTGRPLFWLLAGLTAGLAHLTRADGLLFIGLALLFCLLAAKQHSRWWLGALLSLAGYAVVMTPWFWHLWRTTGSPLAAGGTQTMFLTQYDDVFAYGRAFTLEHYLAWGIGNILTSKLKAVWLAVQTYIAVPGLTAFTFFIVVAWFAARRSAAQRRFLRPFTWYAILLFVSMSLLFTFPGQRGSLLHSSTALWPWTMALAPLGVTATVEWIAARRRHWRAKQALQLFLPAFVLMALVITWFVSSSHPLAVEEAAVYEEIGATLPQDAVVMTGDPPGWYYHTGIRAVVTPNEAVDVLVEAAARYGVDYLLLDEHRPAPLIEFYEGRTGSEHFQLVRHFGDGFQLYRFVQGGGS